MRWPDGDKKKAYQSIIKARTLFIYVLEYVIQLIEFILQNSWFMFKNFKDQS